MKIMKSREISKLRLFEKFENDLGIFAVIKTGPPTKFQEIFGNFFFSLSL